MSLIALPAVEAAPRSAGRHMRFLQVDGFPGLPMMRLAKNADGWSGSITTDWYGDVPLRAVEVTG